MKKIFLISALALSSQISTAQDWLHTQQGPTRNFNAILNYQEQIRSTREAGEDKDEKHNIPEGKNYHFDRWKWYWEQHTDTNGNLVGPAAKQTAWDFMQAQKAKRNQFAKTTAGFDNWSFQGPNNSAANGKGIGRINTVAFHPTEANTFWIGSAGGGPWKTTDGGLSWAPVYNNMPTLGVSDIEFNPGNPNSIFICTGDRNAADNYSIGLLKSTNGGNTWDTTGFKYTASQLRLTNDLAINRLDTNTLLLATSEGIFKSTDGGATWSIKASGHFKQIEYNVADTSIALASGYNEQTGNFILGTVFYSTNGGDTWQASSGIIGGKRAVFAQTTAAANCIKAIVSKTSDFGLAAIYASSDSGKTFRVVMTDSSCSKNILANNANGASCGGQGWYDLSIAASPLDTNKVVVGGVNTWYSLNGGKKWSLANQWTGMIPGIKTVHADKHYHVYHPLNPNTLFECNDGGVYKSADATHQLWTDLSNGLGITQFYRMALSPVNNFVIGGAQDNGSKKISPNFIVGDLTGGDGMDCQMHNAKPNIFFTSIYYGTIYRTTNSGANFSTISNNIPGGPTGDWVTPFALCTADNDIIVAGYQKVYASQDNGTSWTAISPNIVSGSSYIKKIAIADQNPNYIYVSLGTSVVRYTDNMGINPATAWKYIYAPSSARINNLCIDPKDPKIIYVVTSGYGTNFRMGKYNGNDSTWTWMNAGLPNVPANAIEVDSNTQTLYLGNDIGVYYKDTSMTSWMPFNTNLPNAEVTDLDINYATNEIWASTYGRGIWKSPIGFPTSITVVPFLSEQLQIAPNPSNGQFSISAKEKLMDNSYFVYLYDLTGKICFQELVSNQQGNLQIQTNGLAKGQYILELRSLNQVSINRAKVIIY